MSFRCHLCEPLTAAERARPGGLPYGVSLSLCSAHAVPGPGTAPTAAAHRSRSDPRSPAACWHRRPGPAGMTALTPDAEVLGDAGLALPSDVVEMMRPALTPESLLRRNDSGASSNDGKHRKQRAAVAP